MFELQKLLTHASPQMTHRYAHLHDDALRKASELAGSLFSEAGAEEGAQSRGSGRQKDRGKGRPARKTP
jgi:hypothetical protein